MKLLLVRHGQTQSNIVHSLDTRPPGATLTEEGRRQALAVVDRLAERPIEAVYASVATRAQETAEPLAAKLGLPVRTLTGVHEVFAGDLEGHTALDSQRTYHGVCRAWGRGDLDATIPGGENGHQFLDRYRGALATLRAAHELAVLFSHGAAIRIAVSELAENLDPAATVDTLLTNTEIVELTSTGNGWRCTYWDGVV